MVSKADIELELQTTLGSGYTTTMISDLSDLGESVVQEKTGRSSFTGSAAYRYNRAVLCYIISRLVSTAPSLMKGSIESISENSTSIKFGNGKGISTYEEEFKSLIAGLRIKAYSSSYSYTNNTTFYGES